MKWVLSGGRHSSLKSFLDADAVAIDVVDSYADNVIDKSCSISSVADNVAEVTMDDGLADPVRRLQEQS